MATAKDAFFENRPTVLVRAFRDQPAKLVAVSSGRGLVEVANATTGTSIRVQAGSVYRYKDNEFRRMVEAFENGDLASLNALWEKAQPFAA